MLVKFPYDKYGKIQIAEALKSLFEAVLSQYVLLEHLPKCHVLLQGWVRDEQGCKAPCLSHWACIYSGAATSMWLTLNRLK